MGVSASGSAAARLTSNDSHTNVTQELTIEQQRQYEAKLADLRMEHRDLDIAIEQLGTHPLTDQLALQRMKKRKLLLKDQITTVERLLLPDEPA